MPLWATILLSVGGGVCIALGGVVGLILGIIDACKEVWGNNPREKK